MSDEETNVKLRILHTVSNAVICCPKSYGTFAFLVSWQMNVTVT